jgi:hypothetical protein
MQIKEAYSFRTALDKALADEITEITTNELYDLAERTND